MQAVFDLRQFAEFVGILRRVSLTGRGTHVSEVAIVAFEMV